MSAGPVIAASSAAGMPSGSEGNAQPASGAYAIALPASIPARIVAEASVRSIFSLSLIAAIPAKRPLCVLHEMNRRVLPQALTTRSISTQAPSGNAATPIVVRAGNGWLKCFA